jgi:hypothetical protein
MTDFLAGIPDGWMLLSIVLQYPRGLSDNRLTDIALQIRPPAGATSGQVYEVNKRMEEHVRCRRVTRVSRGPGLGWLYLPKQEETA